MDEHPVTAAEFRRFVRDTGYVTSANALSTLPTTPMWIRSCLCRVRSSSVRPRARSTSTIIRDWWDYVPGAYWQRPGGPGHHD